MATNYARPCYTPEYWWLTPRSTFETNETQSPLSLEVKEFRTLIMRVCASRAFHRTRSAVSRIRDEESSIERVKNLRSDRGHNETTIAPPPFLLSRVESATKRRSSCWESRDPTRGGGSTPLDSETDRARSVKNSSAMRSWREFTNEARLIIDFLPAWLARKNMRRIEPHVRSSIVEGRTPDRRDDRHGVSTHTVTIFCTCGEECIDRSVSSGQKFRREVNARFPGMVHWPVKVFETWCTYNGSGHRISRIMGTFQFSTCTMHGIPTRIMLRWIS